jgi:hypothetical protein
LLLQLSILLLLLSLCWFFLSFWFPGSVLNVSSSSCLLSQLSLSFLSILNILTSMSSRIVHLIENEVIVECRSADQASEDLAAERCMCSQFFRGKKLYQLFTIHIQIGFPSCSDSKFQILLYQNNTGQLPANDPATLIELQT